MQVHNEEHPYVSETVSNTYLYGEDEVRNSETIFITEGVADCIAAIQHGFPCVSPVTVQFSKKDHPKLIEITRRANRVYIVNDNEVNEAGRKGMLATAEALWRAGKIVKMIELPRPEGVDKVDLNDFLREQAADALKALLPTAKTLLDIYLEEAQGEDSQSDERRERVHKIFSLLAYIEDTYQLSQFKDSITGRLGIAKRDYAKMLDAATEKLDQERKRASENQQASQLAAQEPEKPDTWPYEVVNGYIVYCTEEEDEETGEVTVKKTPLCNFNAWIVADIASDDGEEATRKIALAGSLPTNAMLVDTGAKLPQITIPADEFEAMQWPVAMWGARVSIEPGRGIKDRLRHAIQVLSRHTMQDRRTYTHTGWRVIKGERVFLHAGGTVGGENIDVDLPKNLLNYRFPSDGDASLELIAMRESIALLDIAPTRVSAPLWAAMYAAPLTEIILPAFTLSNEGGSGSLKSSYCAVMLNHFGAGFNEYAMPADWLATANSLERLCFHAKDVPLIIDDLRPTTSIVEGRTLQDAVARITRAAGNRQGRSRLDANSEFKRTYPPRGVVMTTAERKALGKSVNARILTVDTEPGDVDPVKLAAAQRQRYVYAYAMRGFIRYVAENWEELSQELPAQVADVRAANSGNGHHRRLPNATAVLYTAFNCAMSYAKSIGAIEQAEAERRMTDCYHALQNIAEIQNQATEAEDPAEKYITIIATLLAQDKAHLDAKGNNPTTGKPYPTIGAGLAEKLGWHDGRTVYLLPGCYNTVCKYASAEGWMFPSDENTLRKELERGGYLTKADPKRLTTVQRSPDGTGALVRVTAIAYDKLAAVLKEMGEDL